MLVNCYHRYQLVVMIKMKPEVKINTLFKEQCHVDPISILFIISEMTVGLNRLPLLQKVQRLYVIMGYVYSIFCILLLYCFAFAFYFWEWSPFSTIIDITSYLISIVICSFLWKRLHNYYLELVMFDSVAGCEIKLTRRSIVNVMQALFSITCILGVVLCTIILPDMMPWLAITVLPMKLLHTVDFHFSGHLLSLIIPRLQLINYYLSTTYATDMPTYKLDKAVKIKEGFQKRVDINKIIELYYIIIKVYDSLNNAIKWQLLFMIIETFLMLLRDLYFIAMEVLFSRQLDPVSYVMIMNIVAVRFLPVFSVCVTGDTLHKEVLRLREMLACTLYEGKLERRTRRSAEALLTLTEARNLSFSLFHMFNIDMSLPFKMVSLLITYLIIMLQFEKINRNAE